MTFAADTPCVLVVEDDRVVAYVVRRALEGVGCRVEVCEDGLDARALAAERSFDLVILDHHLPGMLGMELLSEWRRQGLNWPVIMLTGLATEDRVVDAFELGVAELISKPFSVAELQAKVRAELRRSLGHLPG
jgi:DNA-binding response OmpR family regulator